MAKESRKMHWILETATVSDVADLVPTRVVVDEQVVGAL